ncbi:MAG: M24 family metallopeptidase [Actinomycetota bacterium]
MSVTGPFSQPYPRFSDGEMVARRNAIETLMAAHGTEHLVVYGANRFGSAVGWLTRWPVTREALVILTPGRRDTLLVNFYNHVPNAERIATEADVRWGGATIDTALEELDARGGKGRIIGVLGPLDFSAYGKLSAFASKTVNFNPHYTELRLKKSSEEIEWLRVGATLTDKAVRALHSGASIGMDERELGNLVERAYVGEGGTTHIHYFGLTSMTEPTLGVPAQWPSTRRIEKGDVLTGEISASFWDHPGQLLRTFAVGSEPNSLYRELHEAADDAFEAILSRLRAGATAADLVDAASVIEDAGFTTRDDLVHGFVGGYLPPILGSKSRTLEPVPDFTFEAGMTVVVQPNVVTPDERAGVQTGELLLIEEEGAQPLHDYERGFLSIENQN